MTTSNSIYQDIATRTGGDIYIGVVGPVRTGKSTFIKQFMDTLVLPNIDSEYSRERAVDELPQSSAGRTIMTTEPKFIPEQAVGITVSGAAEMKVRMIDCVGYVVPSALGYIEENAPRMVKTPWFDEEVPFNMAAEVGTQKVIAEHSTIGLVITTDGSITEIPRAEYAEAEARVIGELQALGKPFAVLLNTTDPSSAATAALCAEMSEVYGVPVCPVNCLEISEEKIREILETVLFEFPVNRIGFKMPPWVMALDREHPVRRSIVNAVRESVGGVSKIRELEGIGRLLADHEYVSHVGLDTVDLGSGSGVVELSVLPELFYQVLSETTGIAVADEGELMTRMNELAAIRRQYEKIRGALEQVEATGYGIVMPALDEMSLDEPEIIKQSGRYGVRLRATAPSIHLMKANITTEVAPIVGSEKQSEELVNYLLREFEADPAKIWDSNIFGTSLYGLVNEGLHNKLYRMPGDARLKLKDTVERIINEGCNGLICIIV
ncbi:MAG: stage IV sporulation protein A [Clostridia bacterium]|nr:stage IV sporulation protein A [Clostridia bacterium]MBR2407298.1 stage IV sporulation protein A [Clostridia bacterium]